MVVSFTIDPKSSYETQIAPANQLDINKIGGIIFGLGSITNPEIHENSIRLGMCGDPGNPNLINVYLYYYNKGVRYSELLSKSLYGIYNSWYIGLDRINNQLKINNRMGPEKLNVNFDFSGVPTWGFYCYPYFGGTACSPVDYIVDLAVTTMKT